MEITLAGHLGEIPVLVCSACGAAVLDMQLHRRWHEGYNRVAEGARWGAMNRPIG